MKRLMKPLLALAVTLLLLGLAELTVRLFFADSLRDRNIHADAAKQYAGAGMLRSLEADGLRYLGSPNAEVTIREITYAHNSLGLRGPEPSRPRPDGLYRILLLGDSNTYGWGIALEQTFGWLTAQLLNQESEEARPVEVINAGFVGYNTGDACALFRRLGEELRPDLVLLVWFANDLERFGFHVSTAGHLFCDPLPLPDSWKPTLWRSHLYRKFSVWRFARLKASGRFVLGKGQNLTYGEDRLRALSREVVRQGARFALVNMPVLEPSRGSSKITPQGYNAKKESDWLAGLAERLEIPLLDLLPAVSDRGTARYWVSLDPPDHHPNALANERFAETLAPFLVERKLVPARD